MSFVLPNMTHIVIVTKNGYVNKISLDIIKRSNRGKAGDRIIKLKKDDSIIFIAPLRSDNVLHSIQGRKEDEIKVSDIPEGSTVGCGIKLFNITNRVHIS